MFNYFSSLVIRFSYGKYIYATPCYYFFYYIIIFIIISMLRLFLLLIPLYIVALSRAVVNDAGLSGEQFAQGRQTNIYMYIYTIYHTYITYKAFGLNLRLRAVQTMLRLRLVIACTTHLRAHFALIFASTAAGGGVSSTRTHRTGSAHFAGIDGLRHNKQRRRRCSCHRVVVMMSCSRRSCRHMVAMMRTDSQARVATGSPRARPICSAAKSQTAYFHRDRVLGWITIDRIVQIK